MYRGKKTHRETNWLLINFKQHMIQYCVILKSNYANFSGFADLRDIERRTLQPKGSTG